MEKRTRVDTTWESYGDAVRLFARGATVRTSSQIALVVGTWLSLLNQGRAIADGNPPWIKIALNYLTPFLVASLGYLAARRRRNIERSAALLHDAPDTSGAGS